MAGFVFQTVPVIEFGNDSRQKLPAHAQRLGMSRAMIVTDRGLWQNPAVQQLGDDLRAAGIDVDIYLDVIADPPDHVVQAAANKARARHCDGVIGIGGGSAMDVAKLVALLIRAAQPLESMYGVDQVREKRVPLILMPTTAGTGSEVTPIAIVTTGNTTKAGIVSQQLLPDVALLDPQLTLALPPTVTAHTGIDAMVHAIEAYTSIHRKNPQSDLLAREALRLLSDNIERVFADGDDIDARGAMLRGAMLAGQAFANAPVAAVHALAYPLGGIFHLSHGLSNALVLAPVLRFNLPAAAAQYAELRDCISGARLGTAAQDAANAMIERLVELMQAVKIPACLQQAGIPEDSLPELARQAMLQQRLLVNNPRPVQHEDALAIYQSAW
jgi:alcohol dehydrogenase class IV